MYVDSDGTKSWREECSYNRLFPINQTAADLGQSGAAIVEGFWKQSASAPIILVSSRDREVTSNRLYYHVQRLMRPFPFVAVSFENSNRSNGVLTQ